MGLQQSWIFSSASNVSFLLDPGIEAAGKGCGAPEWMVCNGFACLSEASAPPPQKKNNSSIPPWHIMNVLKFAWSPV
jgi:hypothetical protein